MRTLAAEGREVFCPSCSRERHRIRQGQRRQLRTEGSVSVPLVSIEELARQVARLERRIGQVLAAQQMGADASSAQRLLTIATKEMTVLVHNEFIPRLMEARARPGGVVRR